MHRRLSSNCMHNILGTSFEVDENYWHRGWPPWSSYDCPCSVCVLCLRFPHSLIPIPCEVVCPDKTSLIFCVEIDCTHRKKTYFNLRQIRYYKYKSVESSSRKHTYIILTSLNPTSYCKTSVYRGVHYFLYICSKEAVLTSTHNLCFEQKCEK